MPQQFVSILTLSLALTGIVAPSRFVTPAGAQAGADANALGVARTGGISGDLVPVDVLGTSLVEAGAAVSAGDTVKADASGRAVTWATSGARIGIALGDASAAGDLIEVLLIPNAA